MSRSTAQPEHPPKVTDLLIRQKCESMIKYGYVALRQFPKFERHVLAAELRTSMWAQSASSGAPAAATRQQIQETFDDLHRRAQRHLFPPRGPERPLKAIRKELQHDARSSAP